MRAAPAFSCDLDAGHRERRLAAAVGIAAACVLAAWTVGHGAHSARGTWALRVGHAAAVAPVPPPMTLADWPLASALGLAAATLLALAVGLDVRRHARRARRPWRLAWDGADWRIGHAGALEDLPALRALQVAVDFGGRLWLRSVDARGRTHWHVASRAAAGAHWHALRIALQHHARPVAVVEAG